jgi:hypothetical protein
LCQHSLIVQFQELLVSIDFDVGIGEIGIVRRILLLVVVSTFDGLRYILPFLLSIGFLVGRIVVG